MRCFPWLVFKSLFFMYSGLLVRSTARDELVFSDWVFAMLQRTQVNTGSVSWQVSNIHNHSAELIYSIWKTYLHKIKLHLRRFHNAQCPLHTYIHWKTSWKKSITQTRRLFPGKKVKKSRSKNRHVRPAQWHVTKNSEDMLSGCLIFLNNQIL